jgi:hypothetical protein
VSKQYGAITITSLTTSEVWALYSKVAVYSPEFFGKMLGMILGQIHMMHTCSMIKAYLFCAASSVPWFQTGFQWAWEVRLVYLPALK